MGFTVGLLLSPQSVHAPLEQYLMEPNDSTVPSSTGDLAQRVED